jgi:hypothetical protein
MTNNRIRPLVLYGTMTIVASCTSQTFSGNATFVDHGFWSWRPRYEIRFQPEIYVSEKKESVFKFRGAPQVPMDFVLLISPPIRASEIVAIPDLIVLRMRDDEGRSICSFRSKLGELKINEQDRLAIGLWDASCINLALNPAREYLLEVSMESDQRGNRGFRLIPYLSGGGWDYP